MRFFHLDRANSLKIDEGSTIELKPIPRQKNIELMSKNLMQQYPNGVSQHGISYLLDSYKKDSITSEWFLEYERKINFLEKPSRFQSVFAFKELDDIRRFISKVEFNQDVLFIYELEAEHYFKGDMQMVGSQSSPLIQSAMAQAYWEGKSLREMDEKFINIIPLWEYLLVPPIKVIGKFTLKLVK